MPRRSASWRGRGAGIALAVLLLGAAPPAAQAETDPGRVVFDAAVLRPLGLVQTVVSAAILVAAYPVAALTGATDEVVEICWTQPVDQTFRRPLGEL